MLVLLLQVMFLAKLYAKKVEAGIIEELKSESLQNLKNHSTHGMIETPFRSNIHVEHEIKVEFSFNILLILGERTWSELKD